MNYFKKKRDFFLFWLKSVAFVRKYLLIKLKTGYWNFVLQQPVSSLLFLTDTADILICLILSERD